MSSQRNPLAVLRSLPRDGTSDDARDSALREAGLQRAARPPEPEPGAGLDLEAPARWTLPELSGRLSELCAGAAGRVADAGVRAGCSTRSDGPSRWPG